MAKLINGLLGNSRNKIGSIVTYVSKGQQIARSKAANISNPRTASQMTQRIKLSNVVAMYRANKGWMDRYAFENKPTRWSVFNAFVSANLSASLVALTKQEAAAGACVVAPYKMTEGSLNEITLSLNSTTQMVETNLFVGNLTITAETTIAQVSEALIANNNGIVEGMQLSLIENFQTSVNSMPKAIVRAHEFIISTTDTTLLYDRFPALNVRNNALAYDTTLEGAAQGICFVISHTISGKTFVSPSTMLLTDTGTYDSYTDSAAVAAAIESYGSANETPFLDSTAVGSASNSDVSITRSILYAKIDTGAATSAGQYLGILSQGKTLHITLNQNVSAADIENVAAVCNSPEGSFGLATPSVDGNTISCECNDDEIEGVVKQIDIDFSDGTGATISFAVDDSGVTE